MPLPGYIILGGDSNATVVVSEAHTWLGMVYSSVSSPTIFNEGVKNMSKRTRLIPFRWLPGSYGLSGKPYEEAEAYYYLNGEELDRRLIEIKYSDDSETLNKKMAALDHKYGYIDEYEYNLVLAKLSGDFSAEDKIDLDFKYGKIDEYERDLAKVILSYDEDTVERKVAELDVKFKHGKIERKVYGKDRANLLEEPWIDIVDHGFNPEQGLNGIYFEFDWNQHWIEYLQYNGYTGFSEEEMVENWFSDVCRSQGALVEKKL